MANVGRIYMLLCEGGYWYAGSTTNVEKRTREHKSMSKTMNHIKVYNHINSIGWDNVVIVHVKDVMYGTVEELRTEEQKYIKLDDPLCLNSYSAYITTNEKTQNRKLYKLNNKERIDTQSLEYRTINRQKLNEKNRLFKINNADAIREQNRLYRERNADRIRERREMKAKQKRDEMNQSK